MSLVKFNHDVSPYCKGDVVNLDSAEKKRVDGLAEERGLESAYNKYEATKEDKAVEKK